MSRGILDDPMLTSVSRSLDHLSHYQRVIGHNVANVDTPGYRSKTVSFASRLDQAKSRHVSLAQTNQRHLPLPAAREPRSQVTERSGIAPRVDGNTVDINREMIELVETSLKYRTLSQLASKRLILLRTLASEG